MTAYYNEHDPHAAAWIRELIKAGQVAPGEVDTRSITDVQADDVRGFTQAHFFAGIAVWSYALRLAGWPDDRPVWTGSCPCQSFSAAGKSKGFDDPRHLWPAWFNLIRECRPNTVFGEQVEAAIRHGWLDLVQADLERESYRLGSVVWPAAGINAPHIRSRLYWVANAKRASATRHREHGRSGEATKGIRSGLADCVEPDRLADTKHAGRATREDNGRPDRGATAYQREVGAGSEHRESAGCCHEDGLADTKHSGYQCQQEQHTARVQPTVDGETGSRSATGAHCTGVIGLADTSNARRKELHSILGCGGDGIQQTGRECQAIGDGANDSGKKHPNENHSPWRAVDWLFCRDGKWRPVESWVGEMAPGTADRLGYRSAGGGYSLSPLQEKAENRVMRLRGYGNSIVAPQAAEFIQAFMEVGK